MTGTWSAVSETRPESAGGVGVGGRGKGGISALNNDPEDVEGQSGALDSHRS